MEGPLFEIRSTKEAALAQRDIVLMRTTMETIRALANTIGVAGSLHSNFAGLDEGLEENLRSFFEQDYPAFEMLFAVRDWLRAGVALSAGGLLMPRLAAAQSVARGSKPVAFPDFTNGKWQHTPPLPIYGV